MARQMVINYGMSDIGPWSLMDPSAQQAGPGRSSLPAMGVSFGVCLAPGARDGAPPARYMLLRVLTPHTPTPTTPQGDMLMRMMARNSMSENLQERIDENVRAISMTAYEVGLREGRGGKGGRCLPAVA